MSNDGHKSRLEEEEESRPEEAIAKRMTTACKFAGLINQVAWEAADLRDLRASKEPGEDLIFFCHTNYGKVGLCASCQVAYDRLLQAIAFDRWVAAQEVPKSTAFSGSVQKILNDFRQMLPTIVREAYEDVASHDEQARAGFEVEVQVAL